MVFSNLITGTIPHSNKYHKRTLPVQRVILHHWAGLRGGDTRLANPNQQVSCTYLIYSDGRINGQVPEEFRPWTSGGWHADNNAITIEIQNSGGQLHGDDNHKDSWAISALAFSSLISLLADIAKRHNLTYQIGGSLDVHRTFQATACPGGYIMARLPEIRDGANDRKGGKTPSPAPKPPKQDTVASKSLSTLVSETFAGVYGNGDERRRRLGSRYAEVQAAINKQLYGGSTPAPKPAPKPQNTVGTKSLATLVQETLNGVYGNGDERRRRLGSRYTEVQNAVNKQLNINPKRVTVKSANQLADEVLAGMHGNGEVRKQRLGSRYAEVQAIVNRRLGIR